MHRRQYLNRTGTADSYLAMGQLMTSWGLIHQALRSMFPKDRYYEGTPLEDFEQTDHGVRSQFCGTGANSVCLADRRGRFAILGETEANFIAFRA